LSSSLSSPPAKRACISPTNWRMRRLSRLLPFSSASIITDAGYKTISAAEYERLCNTDQDFADKCFEKFNNELIEVAAEEHEAEEKRANHERHLRRRDRRHGLVAYESWDTDTLLGADMIPDCDVFVEDDAMLEIMAGRLKEALAVLSEAERELIEAIFFDELTEREYSARSGIPQKTINDRKRRILLKLRKIINSKK